METESKYKCFSLFLFSLVFISTIHSQDPEQSVMDINNIISWVRNDGYHDWVINDSFNVVFPKGTAGGIMNDGICWGGKLYDENPVIIRVNGCDTSFNMGYSYNSNDQDIIYSKYLPAPPALGYLFLNGSSFNTGNNFDSAIVNFKWRKGYKFFHPKPLTVSIGFKAGDTWSYPDYTYNGI